MAAQHDTWKSVNRHPRCLAQAYSGRLRLLVVGDHPDIGQRYERDHLGAKADVLTGPNLSLADHSIDRRGDAGVAKSDFGEIVSRLLGLKGGIGLHLLSVQHIELLPLLRQLRLI